MSDPPVTNVDDSSDIVPPTEPLLQLPVTPRNVREQPSPTGITTLGDDEESDEDE
jgi:hypothetical protein